MADTILREIERNGDWSADLALRYGLMTEGDMQSPPDLQDAECHVCKKNKLIHSDCFICSFCRIKTGHNFCEARLSKPKIVRTRIISGSSVAITYYRRYNCSCKC